MDSHEYANKLKAAAEFLLSRDNAEFGTGPHLYLFFYEKEPFVSAVSTFGPGAKKWTEEELFFTPNAPCDIFRLSVPRNKVCRLVRPAEYECEPILSEEEVEAL